MILHSSSLESSVTDDLAKLAQTLPINTPKEKTTKEDMDMNILQFIFLSFFVLAYGAVGAAMLLSSLRDESRGSKAR
jgi:hypothetical protein